MSKISEKKDSFLPPLWLLTIAGIILFIWILFELKELVVLLVVSYAISYMIHPVLTWLETKKISRNFGFFLIAGFLILFFFFLFRSAVPTLISEYKNISMNFPQYFLKAKEKVLPLIEKIIGYLPSDSQNLTTITGAQDGVLSAITAPDAINKVLSGVLAALMSGYSLTLTIVNLFLLPFMVYYISVDMEIFHSTVLGLFPWNTQKKVSKFFAEINQYVSAFVRGQLMVCSVLFVLYAIGLRMVGIELWLLLAFISGFGNLIPYVGFLSGIVLSSIMALVTFGDFIHLIQVWIVFGIVQILEGFFITPKIIGSSVGLSPLIIIIALFVGGQAFGLLGIFLAIPGAAILRVTAQHLHKWVLNKSKA